MTNNQIAAKLVSEGYRVTSKRWCIVSRVDRPDWKSGPDGELGSDYYRRVLSKDRKQIPRDILRLIPTSCHDPVGFCAKEP